MKLTKITILALRGTNKDFKERMAAELGVNYTTIARKINDNEQNGLLTTAKSLQMIREETGLTDAEILEEDTVKESEG
jgi:DNA-binding transcriptional regulator YhcF (GntR family)